MALRQNARIPVSPGELIEPCNLRQREHAEMASYFEGQAFKAQVGEIPGGEYMRLKLTREAQWHRDMEDLYRRWEVAFKYSASKTIDLDIEDLAYFGL